MNKSPGSVQSAEQEVWSWGNMYLPKHGKWSSQHLYLKMNSGFHARMGKNPKNNIWKWSFIDPLLRKKAHLCLRPCSLDNTLNRRSSAWDSFIGKARPVCFQGPLTYQIFPQFVSNLYICMVGLALSS